LYLGIGHYPGHERGDTMIDTQKLIADADAAENFASKTRKHSSCPQLKRS
jgi:hypothetical protein